MKCPHCQGEFEVPFEVPKEVTKGGIYIPDQEKSPEETQKYIPPFRPSNLAQKRGPNRRYSQDFEAVWALYGRKQEKQQAFKAWLFSAGEVGGERALRDFVVAHLAKQGPIWGTDGWKFAPYFERYLKRRKWEDEPMPQAAPETPQERIRREQRDRDRQDTRKQLEATERQLAKFRPYQNGHPQPGQVQSLVAELAEQKAVTK